MRFCGDPCQIAFYDQSAPLRIGFGLFDDVAEVPVSDLTERLEATFRPYAGPGLPGVLAVAFHHSYLTHEGHMGAAAKAALSKQRFKEIVKVVLGATFLGWNRNSLAVAIFDHSLEHGYDHVTVMILSIDVKTREDGWGIWGMPNAGDPYNAARVAYIFSHLEAMDLSHRQRLSVMLTVTAVPTVLMTSRVHFARHLLRLCAGADMPDQTLKVLNEGPLRNGIATMHELVAVSGEAGARLVFGEVADTLQQDITGGHRNPLNDRTVLLAREIAKEHDWR